MNGTRRVAIELMRARRLVGPIAVALLAGCAVCSPAEAKDPSVAARGGVIVVVDGIGQERRVPGGQGDREPALSPDGRTVAFVRPTGPVDEDGEGPSALMVAPVDGGPARPAASGPAPDHVRPSVATPRWSPEGHTIYVVAGAYEVSGIIVAVDASTGRQRAVIDGNAVRVITSGPQRGDLLVRRHRYRPGPQGGAYDPWDLVGTDGHRVLTVPGTDRDDDRDHLSPWLKHKGWTAS